MANKPMTEQRLAAIRYGYIGPAWRRDHCETAIRELLDEVDRLRSESTLAAERILEVTAERDAAVRERDGRDAECAARGEILNEIQAAARSGWWLGAIDAIHELRDRVSRWKRLARRLRQERDIHARDAEHWRTVAYDETEPWKCNGPHDTPTPSQSRGPGEDAGEPLDMDALLARRRRMEWFQDVPTPSQEQPSPEQVCGGYVACADPSHGHPCALPAVHDGPCCASPTKETR